MHENRYHLIISLLFSTFLSAFLAFCFYFTPVGDELEKKLFHVRNRLKPSVLPTEGVEVMATPLNVLNDHQWVSSIDAILKHHPKTLSLIFSQGIEAYPKGVLKEALKLERDHDVVFLGINGFDRKYPVSAKLPSPIADQSLRIFGYDGFGHEHELLTEMPFGSFRGPWRRNLLPSELAGLSPEDYDDGEGFLVNFVDTSRIPYFNLEEHQDRLIELKHRLKGKHIFVQLDPSSSSHGASWKAARVAGLTLNLIHHTQLDRASEWVYIVQTVVVSAAFGSVWILGVSWSVFLILFSWGLLMLSHSLVMAYLHIFIPIADTSLFSLISGIMGGLWRLSLEGQLKVEQEVRTKLQRDMADTQTKFLENFSSGLSLVNNRILSTVRNHVSTLRSDPTLDVVYLGLQASSEELQDYLNGIRDFTKMTSSKQLSIQRLPFSVRPVIERVVSQFVSKCEERQLRICIDCPLETKVLSTESLIEPILTNLISNAVKYSPDGGVVFIKVTPVRKRSLSISVQDQGPGIHKNFHELIFEKFYRVEGDTRLTTKGNGLGLYLCRFFANKVGAKISVQSEPGQGATFTITLFRV